MQILNTELFDDLKCCGNCKNRKHLDSEYCTVEEFCTLKESYSSYPSNKICPKWEYDNLKKADRMIKGD